MKEPQAKSIEDFFGERIPKVHEKPLEFIRRSAYDDTDRDGDLLALLEHGDNIASPSDISAIHAAEGFSSLVSCDMNQYQDTKAVKKTLTIPSWLNDRAISMGINFSQVLQEALLSKIQA